MNEVVEVKWGSPYQIEGVPVCAAPHDGGWLVASVVRPRFCFWGKTQEAAEEIAERGILYCRTVKLPADRDDQQSQQTETK